MIRLNDKPDVHGNVHLLTNLRHKHYVKFGGIQSDDSIDSFHKFMLDNGVWDSNDKVVKSRKPVNFVPGPEYDNISVVLKFYNLGVIACENKMKMRQKEQKEREQRETEYRGQRDNSSLSQSQRESFENLHTTETRHQKNGIVLNVKGKINATDDKPIPVLQLTNPNISHDNISNNTLVDYNIQPLINETPRKKSASFGPIPCEDSDSLDDVDELLDHEELSDDPDNGQDDESNDDSNDDSNNESNNETENDSNDSDNQKFIDLNIPDDNIIEFENKNKSDKNKSNNKSKNKSKISSNIIVENKKSKTDKKDIKPKISKNNKKSAKCNISESDESDESDDISDQSEDFSESDMSNDSDSSNNSDEDISSESNSSEDELPKKKSTTTKKEPLVTNKKPLPKTVIKNQLNQLRI
ncbi:hypothetical protein QJ854_gp722 [Moumouvirus goulette]|uniref:Uncharacterized protein n=1 Tax=Moumouvirus goulette TaxID=1247379 RepID=M1NM18_9VIRU|nr:hypothetical protein QJ854_gp722 [Moumouvirus goulette]AGF85060.1 hypothetical protein glt_00251 [Moumouvirus goulette]